MTFPENRFSQCISYNDPFPCLEFTNFLSKEETQQLCDIFEKSKFDEFVMGNRKNIRKGTKNFNNIVNDNKIVSDIYNFFNNENQFEYLIGKLLSISKNSKNNFKINNRPKTFKDKFYAYKIGVHNLHLIKKFFEFFKRKFPNLNKKFFSCYFLDMVFAIAGKGYEIKTHVDKPTRIIVLMLFLNDLKEEDGGAFEIYSKEKDNDPTLFKRFKPEAGKLVAFLSNPASFHNVQSISNNEVVRKFIYGSYTANVRIEWEKE